MRPQAPYQLPLAYIFKWSRSLTSPVSEAGLSVPPKPPTSLTADDRHVGVADAPVNICEKKKGWSSRNGPRPHGSKETRAGRRPFRERKLALSRLLMRSRGGIQYVEHTEGHGEKLFEAVCELGLEGIVSKRLTSVYRSGRSRTW